MKRILFLLLTLSSVLLGYSQSNELSANDNVIVKMIPKKWNLKDKVILVNKSQLYIMQAVVAVMGVDGEYKPLGATDGLSANKSCEILACYNNELKNLLGKTIAIKVKGAVKKNTFTDNAEDIVPATITYDFDATVYEFRHDLYIEIKSKSNSAGNVMDF